jgi:hypothetical protein
MALVRCRVCGKKYVPEVILSTAQQPPELETVGSRVLIEAHGRIALMQFVVQRKSKLVILEVPLLVSRFRLHNTTFIDNSCINYESMD